MLPLFIFVTTFTGKEPVVLNVNHIMYIKQMKEYGGSVVYMSDGSKITVKEAPDKIMRQMTSTVVCEEVCEETEERTIDEDDD